MMVLTLKVTSAAFNYQDGLIEDEKTLREAQKKYRLKNLPSFVAYLGYCFNCGTHLVGPVFELRDYMDWTENKGLWDPAAEKKPPSPYIPTFLAIIKAFVCMGIFMYLTGAYPLSFVTDSKFMEWGYWHRVWYQYLCGFGTRWKYYFIWSLSEAAVMISGFGFSGWSTSAPSEEPKATWSRAHNVDIVNVELATSAAEIPKYWNIHVSVWLRHYVYERLVVKGKRPGFRQLLATQVVSAVWHVSQILLLSSFRFCFFAEMNEHSSRCEGVILMLMSGMQGLYAGYFLFFVNSALMIAGARGKLPNFLKSLSILLTQILMFEEQVFLLSISVDGSVLTVVIFDAAVIYKWQQVIPKSNFLAVNLGALVGFFYTAFVLNLTVIGFTVSDSKL